MLRMAGNRSLISLQIHRIRIHFTNGMASTLIYFVSLFQRYNNPPLQHSVVKNKEEFRSIVLI